MTADQRLGESEEKIIDVIALLGTDLEDITESFGRDQADGRSLAFDNGIGDERRAVNDLTNLGYGDAGSRDDVGEAVEGAPRRIGGCGQAFVQADGGGGFVEQNEIRERASDIDAG